MLALIIIGGGICEKWAGQTNSQFSKTTSRANRNFQCEFRKKFANAASEKFVCTPLLTGREYANLDADGSYDVVTVMINCTNVICSSVAEW